MDYTLKDVLSEVNEIRFYEFGLPPLDKLPKGSKRCSEKCVITNCFPNVWYTDGDYLCYSDGRKEYQYQLPSVISTFIMDFDGGKWPSLEEPNVSDLDSTDISNSETPTPITV